MKIQLFQIEFILRFFPVNLIEKQCRANPQTRELNILNNIKKMLKKQKHSSSTYYRLYIIYESCYCYKCAQFGFIELETITIVLMTFSNIFLLLMSFVKKFILHTELVLCLKISYTVNWLERVWNSALLFLIIELETISINTLLLLYVTKPMANSL